MDRMKKGGREKQKKEREEETAWLYIVCCCECAYSNDYAAPLHERRESREDKGWTGREGNACS